jgi:hypothetical protein
MFTSGIILFVEKLFLQFVAINFHEKALADRLAENRLGLKALDRLSNAHVIPSQKPSNVRRGHRSTGSSNSINVFPTSNRIQNDSAAGTPISTEKNPPKIPKMHVRARNADRHVKKKMTSVIIDQVGEVIGQITFKHSNHGGIGGLSSARRLARKLFSTLRDSPRSHLTVEGTLGYSLF